MSHAVIVDHAVKTYGDFTAVNGISLTINPGEFFSQHAISILLVKSSRRSRRTNQ